MTVAPRLTGGLADESVPLGEVWGDTTLPLPPGRWREILSGDEIEAGDSGISVRELFARLPVAVLRRTG